MSLISPCGPGYRPTGSPRDVRYSDSVWSRCACGTERAYGASRRRRILSSFSSARWVYGTGIAYSAMRCPVLGERTVLGFTLGVLYNGAPRSGKPPRNVTATGDIRYRDSVWCCMELRVCYAMPGTGTAYGATQYQELTWRMVLPEKTSA
eukprot:3940415-Rhodomonas_salina.1